VTATPIERADPRRMPHGGGLLRRPPRRTPRNDINSAKEIVGWVLCTHHQGAKGPLSAPYSGACRARTLHDSAKELPCRCEEIIPLAGRSTKQSPPHNSQALCVEIGLVPAALQARQADVELGFAFFRRRMKMARARTNKAGTRASCTAIGRSSGNISQRL